MDTEEDVLTVALEVKIERLVKRECLFLTTSPCSRDTEIGNPGAKVYLLAYQYSDPDFVEILKLP